MRPALTVELLNEEARHFAEIESQHAEPSLYGVTDGKAVGTYVEQKFNEYLSERYDFELGSAARGIDFPALNVDLKVTSIRQPQSSCPFRSARQKIFGLGYNLLVFVYEKTDDGVAQVSHLNILHAIFVEARRTGDYQTTTGLRKIIENDGNEDDVLAFLRDRLLPADDIEASEIAKQVLQSPPEIGYLTISNALQWRLQYARVIERAGTIDGIVRVR